jgi:hypothetical protein
MAAPQPAPATYSGGPPAPSFDPTAVFARRAVAAIIDFALLIVPAMLLLTASFEYLDVDELDRDPQEYCEDYMDEFDGFCADMSEVDDRVYFADDLGTGSAAVFWLGGIALLVVLQGLTGWTPGKLITGVRTVKEDGSRPGIGKAFVRWLLFIVDAQPCGIPLVGFICALTTQGHRRVGDMAAKTFVVRTSAAGAPIVVPGLTAPPGPPAGYSQQDGYSTPAPDTWGSAPVQPTPSADGPQWDAARGTYIQWDPSARRWLQWDDSTRTWDTIPGQ